MKITGRVEVWVDGKPVFNKSGATASGAGLSKGVNVERKEVLGDTGLHGFVEMPIVAACEVTVTDNDIVMLQSFADIAENATVVFKAAGGGKVYTMKEATCTGNFTITAGEGEVPLRFFGRNWVESVA